MTTLSKTTIGQYQLNKRMGTGSLGTVYRAEDINLQRPAVVKLIDSAFNNEPELREQILVAARLDSKLAHPAIVPLYNFDNEGEQFYLAMGYVNGLSLRAVLDVLFAWQKRLPLDEILLLMAQMADILSHAHQEGVWHLNLHPGNILIRKMFRTKQTGDPTLQLLLTDFGMTAVPRAGLQTAVSDVSLILPYLSPEQCVGDRLDGRSDMYNFGAILYELITGRTPFQISNSKDALTKHSIETPLPLDTFRDGIPPELERLVQMLMAKKRSERVQLAERLADILRYIAHDVVEEAPQPDTICLLDNIDEMMQLEGMGVTETKTPIRPHRLGTAPLMITNTPTPQQNGTPDTAVATKPAHTSLEKTPPQSGSVLLDTLPTEVSTTLPVNEYLFISRRGSAPKRVQLNKRSILIGRSSKNDIVLDSLDVSRQHVRLTQEENGWEIEDLGSRAGTFCNGVRLAPHQPIKWQPDETILIGSYFLRWHEVEIEETSEQITNVNVAPEPITELFQLPLGGNEAQSTKGQFSAALYPATVSLSPGDKSTIQFELFNQSLSADVYLLSLLGLPAGTAELAQTSISVTLGSRTSLPITFVLPEEGSPKLRALRAGSFPFQLLVCSQTNQKETAVLNGLLLVSPLDAFAFSIWPAQMPNPGRCRVLIRNEGNFPARYSIVAKDDSRKLRFAGQGANIALDPGEAVTKKLKVSHIKRPLFAEAHAIPFEIEVRTNDGLVKTRNAAIRVEPLMPKWVVTFAQYAFVLFLILLGVTAIVSSQMGGGETAVPETNKTDAAPATVTDSDGDALTDSEEAQFGTDPNNPDTDLDGLADGDELHNLSLNPLNSDTDEDLLPDGAEVNIYGTNPLQADTDNDGVSDMDEVQQQTDPLNP